MPKTTQKSQAVKTAKKGTFARFFSKPRNVLLVVFIVGFAGIGAYKLYSSSAADVYKHPFTVQYCKQTGSVLGLGSYGACVKTVQLALNRIKVVFHHDWPTLVADQNFGPQTKAAVVAYQKQQAITADGVVGPNTWSKLIATCQVSSISSYCIGTGVLVSSTPQHQ